MPESVCLSVCVHCAPQIQSHLRWMTTQRETMQKYYRQMCIYYLFILLGRYAQ